MSPCLFVHVTLSTLRDIIEETQPPEEEVVGGFKAYFSADMKNVWSRISYSHFPDLKKKVISRSGLV